MRRICRLTALLLALILPLACGEELIGVGSVSAVPVSTPSADEIAGGREVNDELLDDVEDEEGGFSNVHKKVHILEKSASRFNNILNVSGIPDAGLPIPLIYQFNYRTPFCTIDGKEKSVGSSGCGAVCMSMLIAYLTENYDQTPYTLMYRACAEGNYNGNGLSYDVIAEMLESYRIRSELIDTSVEAILGTQSAGLPVVIKMGPGTFTNYGHYILLRGLDRDGKVYVSDPHNAFHSAQTFDAELIAKECKGSHKQMLVVTSEKKTAAEIEKEILAEQEAALAAERAAAQGIELTPSPKPSAVPIPTPEPTPEPSPTPSPTPEPTPESTPEPTPEPEIIAVRRCNYKSVNLRAAPDKNSRITGTAKKGNRLNVVCVTDVQPDGHKWYGVLQAGEIKYIRDDLTDPVK